MAQLFGKWTIRSNAQVLAWFHELKVTVIRKLYEDWKNWLLNDETKYEQTFNQLFFGELLGYEDRTNRIPKWWVMSAWIADLTLWYFEDGKYDPDNVQVVCELKWAKTNLVKKQFWHGGLSPVGQWFSYKTGLKNCKWLIVSNFYEIRLYRDNQTDFEVWTLDELMDPKDDNFNLRKLYLLLHRDSLLSHSGTSKTEALLSHFREEQKEITNKFYKEYKGLRIELINDMKHNNPWVSIEILIEKAQKIIDRLIFIFFCEDKGLLPDKKLKENIVRSREAGFSPWEVTKKFFGLVDKWSEQLGIPDWYNWWLFQKDEVLDNLEIWDHICKKFVELTNYDFDDKLSVNVLWHIFEQSISDLENLRIDLLGQDIEIDELVDTGKWRRKKDWIFYTPEYIVDYIVQNSVMKYLNEKEDECLSEVSTIDEKTGERRRKKNIDNAEQKAYLKYQQILQNIKVLDPACGSGAFLVRVFDVLLEENKRVWSILNSLFDETETYKNILTNNIYGVDLNAESVEITKLSLRLKSAQKGKKLNNLDGNIKCGNSLIDDPFVAKEKAFDRKREFPKIFWNVGMTLPATLWTKKETGFDVIVGNPPYVTTRLWKLNQSVVDAEMSFYKLKYWNVLEYKGNLYVLFIGIINNLLKKGWKASYITPNSFLLNDTYSKIRRFMLENFDINELNNLTYEPFDWATTGWCCIFLVSSKESSGCITNVREISDPEWLQQDIGFSEINYNKIKGHLEGMFYTNIKGLGIVNKCYEKSKALGDVVGFYQGIITWDNKKFIAGEKIDERYKKVLRWWDIYPYCSCFSDNYVLFDPEMLWSNTDKTKFETKEKLINRQTSDTLVVAYDNQEFYSLDSTHVQNLVDNRFEIKFLLVLENSSLLRFVYKFLVNEWGKTFAQVKTVNLKKLPIKEIPLPGQQPFIEKADQMLTLNKDLQELTDKFLHRIQDNLKIVKLTKKLESFYEGDFKDFLAELKKQKVSLSLAQQDEREPYFKEYKEKVVALKGEIAKVDGEIDQMVFELYGLSEEERRVVLNG